MIVITAIGIAAFLAGRAVHAQPGSESDPVVSLSYLETATSYQTVALEGGEELTVNSGSGIILVQGSAGLVVPQGLRSNIIDISDGDVYSTDTEMIPGHMYIPILINELDENDSGFVVRAWQTSVIAIPGGSGR